MAGGYAEEVEADSVVGESQSGLLERGVYEHHPHAPEEAELLYGYVVRSYWGFLFGTIVLGRSGSFWVVRGRSLFVVRDVRMGVMPLFV